MRFSQLSTLLRNHTYKDASSTLPAITRIGPPYYPRWRRPPSNCPSSKPYWMEKWSPIALTAAPISKNCKTLFAMTVPKLSITSSSSYSISMEKI